MTQTGGSQRIFCRPDQTTLKSFVRIKKKQKYVTWRSLRILQAFCSIVSRVTSMAEHNCLLDTLLVIVDIGSEDIITGGRG